jgi:predicted dienelactone hydrolase
MHIVRLAAAAQRTRRANLASVTLTSRTMMRWLLAAMLMGGGTALTARQAVSRFPSLSIPASADRGGPIRIRITVPAGQKRLPVILFSHGAGYSGDDYRALADYWAAHGFVVIQPTHLDARVLKLAADDPRLPRVWRFRRDDMVAILDHLGEIAAQAPALAGRIDPHRVVAIGHSYGGHTSELLLGATARDPASGARDALDDPRILGGVLLSAPGGWDGVSDDWRRKGPFLDVDWSTMRRPTLVMTGDLDDSPISKRGPVWHEDPYLRAPAGATCLVALARVGHFLGGIGHDGPPASNDPRDRASVSLVQMATLAWARRVVHAANNRGWAAARAQLERSDRVSKLRCR